MTNHLNPRPPALTAARRDQLAVLTTLAGHLDEVARTRTDAARDMVALVGAITNARRLSPAVKRRLYAMRRRQPHHPWSAWLTLLADHLDRHRLKRCPWCRHFFVDVSRNASARRCSRRCTIAESNARRGSELRDRHHAPQPA